MVPVELQEPESARRRHRALAQVVLYHAALNSRRIDGWPAKMGKKKKVRVDFRKNRAKPPRDNQWTRGFQEHGYDEKATTNDERIRAKGDLSRRRTIIQDETADTQSDMP